MIHFIEFSQISSICTEKSVTRFIIPLSADTMKDNKLYKATANKYSDLDALFDLAVGGNKHCTPGDFIKIQVSSGQVIYFIIVKAVDKFQAYIVDTIRALQGVIDSVRLELGSVGTTNRILFPMPSSDEMKLSDTLMIPAILDTLNVSDIEIFVASNGDHAQYIESMGNTIYYKRDSWKSDWMLSLDDVILVDIISQVLMLSHNFKLGKSTLVKCYQACNKHGMFSKIEWYATEFGQFFKLFNPKCHGMINHGLLMNVNHYSKQEPPRMQLIMGPLFPLLKHLAYTQLYEARPRTTIIAKEIHDEYLAAYANKPEQTGFHKQFQKPSKPQENIFEL